MTERQILLNGRWEGGQGRAEVRSPWDGRVVSQVAQASIRQVEEALSVAGSARGRLSQQSTGDRRKILRGVANALERRAEEVASVICAESGKPIRSARVEVQRAVQTFSLAEAELSVFGGAAVPVDLDSGSTGYSCEVRRFPAGVVVGIVPFNFPLNLGAHKVAPALAVGAPIVVKPPPQAPSAQLLLGEMALLAGADPAALQVLPCDNQVAEALATHPRVRIVSFTGSGKVGWHLKQRALGKVVLELGGNAAAVVCEDADVAFAAERCALGAFNAAGQSCIKVQRIFVEEKVYGEFLQRLVEHARRTPVGDPSKDETVVGPVIDDRAAERIESWIQEAVEGGAQVRFGGTRTGRLVSPTVLTEVPRKAKAFSEEIFGPVVVLEKVKTFDEALSGVNDSAYGLQAGVFTHDLRKVRRAFHALEVGGVTVNEYPTYRSDNMPYGGVKGSGMGREGVRYAMADFTEERVLVIAPR